MFFYKKYDKIKKIFYIKKFMKKLEILKILINESISIKKDEKEKIYNFAKENYDKIDEIIKIFEKEKMENIKNIKNYISN